MIGPMWALTEGLLARISWDCMTTDSTSRERHVILRGSGSSVPRSHST
jgi:hypothetical protein